MLLLLLGNFTPGQLTIHTHRGGLVSEARQFLADLEAAYTALLMLEGALWGPKRLSRYLPPEVYWELGAYAGSSGIEDRTLHPSAVLPEFRLNVSRIRIESPGFWEFLGSLNPLQQIREYLNDRHKRRQDRDFREAAEAERLRLENDILQRTVWEKENAVLRDRVRVLRELGYTDDDIRQLIWSTVGRPLAQLGRHQDSNLIGDAE